MAAVVRAAAELEQRLAREPMAAEVAGRSGPAEAVALLLKRAQARWAPRPQPLASICALV